MNNKWLHMITWILIIVGGLNWGLVGLGGFMGSDWNLVHIIFGSVPVVENIVYVLVGLSAIYELIVHRQNCRMCNPSGHAEM